MRKMVIAAVAAGFTAAPGNLACPQERQDQGIGATSRMESQAQQPDLHCASQANEQTNSRGEEQSAQNQPSARGAIQHVDPQLVRVTGRGHIDREQAAKIADALIATAAPQNVNAHISVDAPLPGEADLRPLPPAVVELAPEYRGFSYVVVHDQIAIIDPSTRRVVELIEVGVGEHAMKTNNLQATSKWLQRWWPRSRPYAEPTAVVARAVAKQPARRRWFGW
jgi:Protein of unknown function (DUF1236)